MFGLRYSGFFRSQYENVHYRVEIAQRGYTGREENIDFSLSGSSPLTITWEKQGDEFFVPIKASELSMAINCDRNFKYLDLFTSDPRFFRVSVFRNTKLYWCGYLVSDLYQEEFAPPPYDVQLKAVDGFNLLSSLPFADPTGRKFTTPKISLWEIVEKCYTLLELDLDIADWSNIYAVGMDQSTSPLGQVFVETSKIYAVNPEATYRDALEIALTPFAYQMFQSNGALHIRSVKSLYSTARPLAYHNIAGAGRLLTHTGEPLITHLNQPLITTVSRERIESMWSGFNVQSTSTLEIVPAIKDLTIEVRNKIITDLAESIGFYDLDHYIGANGINIEKHTDGRIKIGKINSQYERSAIFLSEKIEKSSLKYSLNIEIENIGSKNIIYKFEQLVYFQTENGKSLIVEEGEWKSIEDINTAEMEVVEKKGGEKNSMSMDLPNIPSNGKVCFKLSAKSISDWTCFLSAKFEVNDQNDEIEKTLTHVKRINAANNFSIEMGISVADSVRIPNFDYLYELHLRLANNSYTNYWSEKNSLYSAKIVDILYMVSKKFRGVATKKIAANIHTSRHVDMNTIMLDEKYLNTGFFVNSLTINAYVDECDCELVELPNINQSEAEINMKILTTDNILNVVKFRNNIVYFDGSKLRVYDIDGERLIEIDRFAASLSGLYECRDYCAAIIGDQTVIINENAKIIGEYAARHTELNTPFLKITDYGFGFPRGVIRHGGGSGLRAQSTVDLVTQVLYYDYYTLTPNVYYDDIIGVNAGDAYIPFILDSGQLPGGGVEVGRNTIICVSDKYVALLEQVTALSEKIIIHQRDRDSIGSEILLSIEADFKIMNISGELVAFSDGSSVRLFNLENEAEKEIIIDIEFGIVKLLLIKNGYLYAATDKAILRYLL